jgi:lipoate---protein ligase
MQDARWIVLGGCSPADLHATYTGLADAQADDAPPIVIWARPDIPHLSLGASQSAVGELDLGACRRDGIPVIQRPLGGGTVWVDAGQSCFFLIFPRHAAPRRHENLFAACLEAVAEALGPLGLRVHRQGVQDLWFGERKIMGSGAATINRSMVFGASFLRHFPDERFARYIRTPSRGFGRWLRAALRAGMTDLERAGLRARDDALEHALKKALEQRFGWRFRSDGPTAAEHEKIAEAGDELLPDLSDTERRLVPYGIKVSAGQYVLEGEVADCGRLRLWVRGERLVRLVGTEWTWRAAFRRMAGAPLAHASISKILAEAGMTPTDVERVLAGIETLLQGTGIQL